MQWQRIEKPDFGYAVHVPQGWDESLPDMKISPWETARFGDPADRRHNFTVYRAPTPPIWTASETAERVQARLKATGFGEFQITSAEIDGRAGTRLDGVKRDAGRTWAIRQYFVVAHDVCFTLGFGSFMPEEDDWLFTAMAERFEILALA
ncbi:hypothetical protein [Nonomuraea phyllanthi]|uniref:hypothetical protein n=1 Tax=Nonomuraea phyllanthi TaxID=2219224 RepID=UPI001D01427C|nr:hypothetical protein [Nonomuraea phyllanthi]